MTVQFPHDYKSLVTWFLGTYLVFGFLLKFLRSFSFEVSNIFKEPVHLMVFGSNSVLSFFLFLFLTYLAFFFYYPQSKIKLGLGLLVALLLPIALRFLIDQKVAFWLFNESNYRPDISFFNYYRDNTYFAVYYIPSGILYYFYQRNKALQSARLHAEKAKVEAELLQLRSQLNPHFLFNSLNNIYSLAYDKSDNILPALEGLSEVLRYALYENRETVSFGKEWGKTLKLIELEKLRLYESVGFIINIDAAVHDVQIPPLILLPLIENMFKHGDLNDQESPGEISAYMDKGNFIFSTWNKIAFHKQKDKNRGIGVINIEKRLVHLFGEDANLKVSEKDTIFNVILSIPIK